MTQITRRELLGFSASGPGRARFVCGLPWGHFPSECEASGTRELQ